MACAGCIIELHFGDLLPASAQAGSRFDSQSCSVRSPFELWFHVLRSDTFTHARWLRRLELIGPTSKEWLSFEEFVLLAMGANDPSLSVRCFDFPRTRHLFHRTPCSPLSPPIPSAAVWATGRGSRAVVLCLKRVRPHRNDARGTHSRVPVDFASAARSLELFDFELLWRRASDHVSSPGTACFSLKAGQYFLTILFSA